MGEVGVIRGLVSIERLEQKWHFNSLVYHKELAYIKSTNGDLNPKKIYRI